MHADWAIWRFTFGLMLLLSFKDFVLDMGLRNRKSEYYIFSGLEKEYIVIPRNRISSGLGMAVKRSASPARV